MFDELVRKKVPAIRPNAQLFGQLQGYPALHSLVLDDDEFRGENGPVRNLHHFRQGVNQRLGFIACVKFE